jgi:transposase
VNRAPLPPIPEDTANAAHAVFGRNNLYISIGDHSSELFSNLLPIEPSKHIRSSTLTIPMLYLITVFQYMETLPDSRAADAVRARVDWKYGLHLPLHYPAIEASHLCSFRRWLLTNPAGMKNFQTLIQRLSDLPSHTDHESLQDNAAQVVYHICNLSRISEVWETMSQALGALVTRYPDWLRSTSLPHWYARYSRNRHHWEEIFEKPEWEEFVLGIGSDGTYLLNAVLNAEKPGLANLPEIKMLNQVWQVQYVQVEGKMLWRKGSCADCTLAKTL